MPVRMIRINLARVRKPLPEVPPRPRPPSLLARLWSRSFTRILLSVLLICVAAFLYVRLLAGAVEQKLASPDHRLIVELRSYSVVATHSNQIAVEIKTRLNPFRQAVFRGFNYGSDISFSWLDAHNLQIRCTRCSLITIDQMEEKWRDITIHYVIHN